MATLLSKRNFKSFVKNGLFLDQNVFISDFLVQIRNQRLRSDRFAKFQPDWTKDKGARISIWSNTEDCLMTSTKLL